MRMRHERGWDECGSKLESCGCIWLMRNIDERCHTSPHRRLQQITVSCKRSNCNELKLSWMSTRLRFCEKRAHNEFHRFIMSLLTWVHFVDFLVNCHELHKESFHCHQLEEELNDGCRSWYFQNGTGLSCRSLDTWCRRISADHASLKSERSLTGPIFPYLLKDPSILFCIENTFSVIRHVKSFCTSLSIWTERDLWCRLPRWGWLSNETAQFLNVLAEARSQSVPLIL